MILALPSKRNEQHNIREDYQQCRIESWDEYNRLCGGLNTDDTLTQQKIPFMCLNCGTIYGEVTIVEPIHWCPKCEGKDMYYWASMAIRTHTNEHYPQVVMDLLAMRFVHWVNTKPEEYEEERKRIKKSKENKLEELFDEPLVDENEDILGGLFT